MLKLGLIVNPVAGIGGPLALKGSDDIERVANAVRRGAIAQSSPRASEALQGIIHLAHRFDLITFPGVMGESAAVAAGLTPQVIGHMTRPTSAADTCAAAAALFQNDIGLLVFAGGDGTAVNILTVIEDRLVTVGIPTGVKMHSGVFAKSARAAGTTIAEWIEGKIMSTILAEVIDVDHSRDREEQIGHTVHGYMKVPRSRKIQPSKAKSFSDERALAGLAHELVTLMSPGVVYFVGPGTTTLAITTALGLNGTLVGIDVVCDGRILTPDATESQLAAYAEARECSIVVSPIGGQGFVLGRGNQQISARIVRKVGLNRLVVVATKAKLASLGGCPLTLDTGDPALDEEFARQRFMKIICGYRQRMVYPVGA